MFVSNKRHFKSSLFFILILTFSKGAPNVPEYELFSNQLCPNPFDKEEEKDTKYSSIFAKLTKPENQNRDNFLPCKFTLDQPGGNYNGASVNTSVVNFNLESWNFNSSKHCSGMIKLKEFEEFGDEHETSCQMSDEVYIKELLAKLPHYSILNYIRNPKRLGISIYHSRKEDHSYYMSIYKPDLNQLNYLQIKFMVTLGKETFCQVQQYELNIPSSASTDESKPCQFINISSTCGEYNCTDIIDFLDPEHYNKITTNKPYDHSSKILLQPFEPVKRHRLLTLGTLIFAFLSPVISSIILLAAYRWYTDPRHQIRYRRSGNTGGILPEGCSSPSNAQSSLELRETWHQSEPRSNTSFNGDLENDGVVNADLMAALNPRLLEDNPPRSKETCMSIGQPD